MIFIADSSEMSSIQFCKVISKFSKAASSIAASYFYAVIEYPVGHFFVSVILDLHFISFAPVPDEQT